MSEVWSEYQVIASSVLCNQAIPAYLADTTQQNEFFELEIASSTFGLLVITVNL
jgi:hypothetical protein